MTLIHDLQKKALDANISTSNLLRNAYTVAFKLNLPDFEQWINNELNGYKNSENDLPEYRFVTGIMRAKNPRNPNLGWIDIDIRDHQLIELLKRIPVKNKISEIEIIAKSKLNLHRQLPLNTKQCSVLNYYGTKKAILISNQQFHGIVDSVRTKILDWALTLERKGILGEEMNFNETERTAAQNITINNFVGSVTNAPVQQ